MSWHYTMPPRRIPKHSTPRCFHAKSKKKSTFTRNCTPVVFRKTPLMVHLKISFNIFEATLEDICIKFLIECFCFFKNTSLFNKQIKQTYKILGYLTYIWSGQIYVTRIGIRSSKYYFLVINIRCVNSTFLRTMSERRNCLYSRIFDKACIYLHLVQ